MLRLQAHLDEHDMSEDPKRAHYTIEDVWRKHSEALETLRLCDERAQKAERRAEFLIELIQELRDEWAHPERIYPVDVFIPGGSSTDAQSADAFRKVLPHCSRNLESILKEDARGSS